VTDVCTKDCVHSFSTARFMQFSTADHAGQWPYNFCFPNFHNKEVQASSALLHMREKEISKQSK